MLLQSPQQERGVAKQGQSICPPLKTWVSQQCTQVSNQVTSFLSSPISDGLPLHGTAPARQRVPKTSSLNLQRAPSGSVSAECRDYVDRIFKCLRKAAHEVGWGLPKRVRAARSQKARAFIRALIQSSTNSATQKLGVQALHLTPRRLDRAMKADIDCLLLILPGDQSADNESWKMCCTFRGQSQSWLSPPQEKKPKTDSAAIPRQVPPPERFPANPDTSLPSAQNLENGDLALGCGRASEIRLVPTF